MIDFPWSILQQLINHSLQIKPCFTDQYQKETKKKQPLIWLCFEWAGQQGDEPAHRFCRKWMGRGLDQEAHLKPLCSDHLHRIHLENSQILLNLFYSAKLKHHRLQYFRWFFLFHIVLSAIDKCFEMYLKLNSHNISWYIDGMDNLCSESMSKLIQYRR